VRIVWSREAKSDLAALHRYYAQLGSDFAFRTAELAVGAARLLAERPQLGPVIANTLYRKWRVPHTPYLLVYRPDGDQLRIARVVHFAQNWQNML
jgi:toxin ParE1/3/4